MRELGALDFVGPAIDVEVDTAVLGLTLEVEEAATGRGVRRCRRRQDLVQRNVKVEKGGGSRTCKARIRGVTTLLLRFAWIPCKWRDRNAGPLLLLGRDAGRQSGVFKLIVSYCHRRCRLRARHRLNLNKTALGCHL